LCDGHYEKEYAEELKDDEDMKEGHFNF